MINAFAEGNSLRGCKEARQQEESKRQRPKNKKAQADPPPSAKDDNKKTTAKAKTNAKTRASFSSCWINEEIAGCGG
jgi:hypothetical protein